VATLFLDDVEAFVQDALSRASLAIGHHAVDELADERALIQRIGGHVAFRDFSSSWHLSASSFQLPASSHPDSPQDLARKLVAGSCELRVVMPSSAASLRTSNAPASAPARPPRRACRARRDSGRPGDP